MRHILMRDFQLWQEGFGELCQVEVRIRELADQWAEVKDRDDAHLKQRVLDATAKCVKRRDELVEALRPYRM